jgi:two-component system KDP operon response regulator KdpE
MSLTALSIANCKQDLSSRHDLKRPSTNLPSAQEGIFDDGYLRIDPRDRTVTRRGRDADLTPTELRCVLHLAEHPGRVIPYRELLAHVWGPAYADEIYLLQLYMSNLRHKIEENPYDPSYILERQLEGYYFGARSTSATPTT